MPKVDLSMTNPRRDRGGEPLRPTGSNRRRSTWLVIGFIVFFAWVGFGGDLDFGLLTADAPAGRYHHVIPVIGIVTTLDRRGDLLVFVEVRRAPGALGHRRAE